MELALHKKQLMFVESRGNEVFFGGAAGGGKSHVLRIIAILWCMRVPGVQVYLFRRLYKDLLRSHMNGNNSFPVLLQEFIDDKLVKINHSSNEIQWSNGSKIVLSHIQYESDLQNYLSQEIHVALFDEASTFTEKMYRFIRSRVRIGSLPIPDKWKGRLPFIGLASNPRGPMHSYLKRGWVDAAPHGTLFRAPALDGSMLRQFIPSKLRDNPSIVNNDPDYENRLRGLGDPQIVKAYLDGDWAAVEGAAFGMWDANYHVWKRFNIPKSWKIKRGYDYGYSAPYSVLWAAFSNGEVFIDGHGRQRSLPVGSMVICAEMYGDNGREEGLKENVRLTAQKIALFEDMEFSGKVVVSGPADNAIFNKEQGPSIEEVMRSEGVSWKRANKSPGSRVTGLAILRNMFEETIKHIPENPCIIILDNCPRLIEHIPSLQVDEDTGEDVDSAAQPDHDYDVIRYLALDSKSQVKTQKISGF